VLKALIINNKIHKVVLVPSREEGDRITARGYPARVNQVITANNVSIGTRSGGLSAQASALFKGPPRMSGNFDEHLKDMEEDLRHMEDKIDRVRGEERDLSARVNKKSNEINEIWVVKMH
jgi:chromosome segregation ATPase